MIHNNVFSLKQKKKKKKRIAPPKKKRNDTDLTSQGWMRSLSSSGWHFLDYGSYTAGTFAISCLKIAMHSHRLSEKSLSDAFLANSKREWGYLRKIENRRVEHEVRNVCKRCRAYEAAKG